MKLFHEVEEAEALRRWRAENGEELRLDYPLTADSVVFDVGAYTGEWAADIAERYGCFIHLFEPVPDSCAQARQRFAGNPKVRVHEFALGVRTGFADIHLNGTGSSLFGGGEDDRVQVRVREIGSVLDELGLSHVDLCKINIEGAEFDLLEYLLDSGLMVAFGDLQIQFHDVFADAVARRRAIQARLGETHDQTYNYAFVWENWRRRQPTANGHEIIERPLALDMSRGGWLFPDVAERQEQAFAHLLEQMRSGSPRRDLVVAAESLAATGLDRPSVVEVGCASGYVADALEHQLGRSIGYIGLDSSVAMIDLARRLRPKREFLVSSATALPFADDEVDVVFNGVSLMHTVDYVRAIAEAARVARAYCIFHTVPVLERRPTTYLRKLAYGRALVEVCVNEAELLTLFETFGLRVEQTWDSIPYDLGFLLGESTRTRTYLCAVEAKAAAGFRLNIGCGEHFHADWVNLDIAPSAPSVIRHDVSEALPLADGSCRMVYHSHVLEHLPRHQAGDFLAECRRVLRPGGILRVAVPDLESLCRAYVNAVDDVDRGEAGAEDRHQWLSVELIDQFTREESGGEMWRYWAQDPVPNVEYVLERVGAEAGRGMERAQAWGRGRDIRPFQRRPRPSPAQVERFRRGGEVHLWMYDRLSLARLLAEAGFTGIVRRSADQSYAVGFSDYGLDTLADGAVRKPDSLFMEALRP
ncbi:MAG: FkbM family methyltransferase [Magnetospirillum gryphiswaldense]|nr:FkbM family methyltransferase [Magnetospirillum gryphiswaldense]